MKRLSLAFLFGAVWVAFGCSRSIAQTMPVLEFSSFTATEGPSVTSSQGWEFVVNSPVTVNALDAADFGPTTLGQVRLYNVGGVLASSNLSDTDAVEGAPFPFYTAPITPVSLSPGTYYIAEDILLGVVPGGEPSLIGVTGIISNPAISYVGSVSGVGQGTDPTTDLYNLPGGYFGPDFDIQGPPTGTPEPASLALFAALSTAAAVRFGRKRRR